MRDINNNSNIGMVYKEDNIDKPFVKKSTVIIFIIVIIGAFLAITFWQDISHDITQSKCINLVKSGSLVAYPDIKLDKAFNAYFDEGGWIYTVSSDGSKYVTYVGSKNGKSKELKIEFKVDLKDKSFSLEYAGTGERVSNYEMWDTMDTIMGAYYKTGS